MRILDFDTSETLYESESSVIYRAKPVDGTARVILKVLRGEQPSPQRLARFRRDFATASLFHSPRILGVYRQEKFTNTLVSVVEDFGAASLGSLLQQDQPTMRTCLTIAIAVCEGLSDIHSHGFIHKDITPAHILWNRGTNTIKLTGFGIALPIERTLTVPYAPSVLEGTLSYMSPEQTGRMNRPVDYRSDFYSLGVTLYELFTGERPFASEDPLELIHCHIAKRPLPPAKRRPGIPEALSDIVLMLMAKNAEDRYQSTDGIKADLVECLRQLECHGTISLFPPARHDVSSRFQVSAKLYGRANDVRILCNAFDRVLGGELEFTLVNGTSGVGKSSLVQELYRPLAVARGRYVTGKYDQYQRSVPYSAISLAFNSLCDQLLCEPPEIVEGWRQRILDIVGTNGAALIEVIPRLAIVIGAQPALPERESLASQNLLIQLWQDFLQLVCRPEAPLVLFLDDLQWADIASLSLLKTILDNPRLRGLHLVGAYRDNEVESSHPLILMLDELAKAGRSFATIHLEALSHASVVALIADTLSASKEEVSELAHIVYAKTQGNAFFTIEFIKALYADGLLRFNFNRRQWSWDAAGIHAKQITDNVVTLMAGRIGALPEPTQELLKFAACIGNQFSLKSLAVIAEVTDNPPGVIELLAPALRLGVVVARDDASSHADENGLVVGLTRFKFQHDRVQQAAYSLIPEAGRPKVHLHIARHLLSDANQGGDLEGSLFEIVSHFKKGMTCIEARSERLEAARLNLRAGLKARKASAYHASWDHFRVARDLLPLDPFQSDYDLAFQIHLGLARSSYVAGKCDESEALYPLLLREAATTLDKSLVHLVQMDDYHLQGAYGRAVDVQKQNLILLGEQVPTTDREFMEAIDGELALTPQYRGTRSFAELIPATEVQSPIIVATLKTLMGMWISAHLVSNEPMVQWSSVRLANLSLQHGNSEMAAFAYVQFGYICIARLQKFEEGYEYGELALKIADHYDNVEMRGKIYFMFGLCICHWRQHVVVATEFLRKAYVFSVEASDWTYAVYAACNIISNMSVAGVHCDDIIAEADKYLEFLKDKAAVGVSSFFLPGCVCSILNLQGKTASRSSFSCRYLDESVYLNTLGTQTVVAAWFYSHKIRNLYLLRSFDDALDAIARTEGVATALPAQVRVAEAALYSCLLLAATGHLASACASREIHWSLYRRYEGNMKLWAEHCPANYEHKYYLIRGERARLEHDGPDEVLAWYDKSIQSATEAKCANGIALAQELKGRFWLERQQRKYALNDLKEAHYGYQLWGATDKVAMLEEEFSELSSSGNAESLLSPTHLDLQSVHKAARAISANIDVHDFIRTMMTIVMESAGADRGALLLERKAEWQIEACADVVDEGVQVAFPTDRRSQHDECVDVGVPWSVVNYVARMQAPVIVDEPVRDQRFGHDAYILSVVPRSILCVPLINQERISGIIYLENKLAPEVFSADRRVVIDVLTGQIAISLENATLYADVKRTVARQKLMMEELAAQQVALVQTNKDLVDQKLQLSRQTLELRTRNDEINVVSLQRKAAEEETRRLNGELEGRVEERTADLRRSNQELEQFAYVASHDLQEPLRKVSSFAQLLAAKYKGKLDADADEFIGYMVDGAQRMQTLIQNMLAYSRLGRKGQPFVLTDANAVLKRALVNLQGAVEESGALVTSVPLPSVLGDEVQLVQLFQNLIGNAIKFCRVERPEIQIGVKSLGGVWTISVVDNGIGIDPQFAERIFVIFQRLHSREEYSGTGIGLAFCKKIVERHGGRIWVESQPNQGAAFFFTLPERHVAEQPTHEPIRGREND